MNTARKTLLLLTGCLLVLGTALPAFGSAEFVFFGFAKYWDGEPVDAVGSNMEVYGILSEVGGLSFPIALDLDNYEYTLYISTLTVASYSENPIAYLKQLTYDNGEIHIYADPLAGGTAADYGNEATFMDGELILHAVLDDGFLVNLFDLPPNTDGNYTGYADGACDFDAGSQYDALITAEYLLDNWPVHATVADPNSGPGITVPDGYHRLFDVKITPPNDPTDNTSTTWGQIKLLYGESMD